MTIPFVTSGQLGVDLSAVLVLASTTYPQYVDQPPFALGTQVTASDNSVWTFVKLGTGGATAVGYVMTFDEDFLAVMMSNSVGGLGDKVGVWGGAVALVNNYGWVQVYGTCDAIRVSASCAANVALASTTTAGEIDDSVANPTKNITGIVLTTAAGGSAATAAGELNYPIIGTTN